MFYHGKIREYSPRGDLGRASCLPLCQDHADLLHCCGVGYMGVVFLCQAQNLWVTSEVKGTDN